jgi:hypothetical protein
MSFISIISKDVSIIPYRKELNKITGGVTATILLQQMVYWYEKTGGPFYKFKEPCQHKAYVEGSSWCEELGYTRREFDTAYKKLEEAGFLSKKTSIDRMTYYDVNTEALESSLAVLYEKAESAATKRRNAPLVYKETETTTVYPPNPQGEDAVASNKSSFEEFKKEYPKAVPQSCERNWRKLTDQEKKIAIEYIPEYSQEISESRFAMKPRDYITGKPWEKRTPKENYEDHWEEINRRQDEIEQKHEQWKREKDEQ